jgi:effector-binding domain-containing protein
MSDQVIPSTAHARALAAVRRSFAAAELSSQIREILGEVWQFLRDNEVNSTGHNVAYYLSSSGDGTSREIDAWFGVEVHEALPQSDRVSEVSTPAGLVASTIHWGQYDRISEAHTAIRSWCQKNGHELAGPSWEVYGDWSDDWSKVRTDIFYLLKS